MNKYKFISRHKKEPRDRCPVCNDAFSDFWDLKINWVCLQCGCNFTPRSRLAEVKEIKVKLAEEERIRKAEEARRKTEEIPDEAA